jgi:hypothetical protein
MRTLYTGTAAERDLSPGRTDFAERYRSANSLDLRPDAVRTLWVRIIRVPKGPSSAKNTFSVAGTGYQTRSNTSVAFVPPKPKLFDITASSRTPSRRSSTMSSPAAPGSSFSTFADAQMKPCSIIRSE